MKSQIGVRRGQGQHRFILTPVSAASVPGIANDNNNNNNNNSNSHSSSISSNSSNSQQSTAAVNNHATTNAPITTAIFISSGNNGDCKRLTAVPTPSSQLQSQPVAAATVVSSVTPVTVTTAATVTTSHPHHHQPAPPPPPPVQLHLSSSSSSSMMMSQPPGSPDNRLSSTSSGNGGYPTPPPSSGAGPFPGDEDDFAAFCFDDHQSPFVPNSSTSSPFCSAGYSPSAPVSMSSFATSFYEYQQPPHQSHQNFGRLLVRDCMWSPDHSTAASPVNFVDSDFGGIKLEPICPQRRQQPTETTFVNPSSVLPRMCSCSCGGAVGLNDSPNVNKIGGVPIFAGDDDDSDNGLAGDLFHQHHNSHQNSTTNHHHNNNNNNNNNNSQNLLSNNSFGDSLELDNIVLDNGCNRRRGEVRTCMAGQRRTLSSVLKRPADLIDDGLGDLGSSHQHHGNHGVINSDPFLCCGGGSDLDHPVSSPSVVNSLSSSSSSSSAAKRSKRSKSPTVITLSTCRSESSPSAASLLDDDMSHSSNSFPLDVTSYHSYTRNPCLRIMTTGASGNLLDHGSSSSTTTVVMQPSSYHNGANGTNPSSPSSKCSAALTPVSTDSGVVICPSFFQPYPTPTDDVSPTPSSSRNQHLHGEYSWSTSSSRASTPAQSQTHAIFVQPSSAGLSSSSAGGNSRLFHHQHNHHNHGHQHQQHHQSGNGSGSSKRQQNNGRHIMHRPSAKRKNPNDHIKMERERRNDLKATFHHVREEIPELSHLPKPSKLAILDKAREYIETMKNTFEEISAERARLLRANEQMLARLDALQRATGTMASNPNNFVIVSAAPLNSQLD